MYKCTNSEKSKIHTNLGHHTVQCTVYSEDYKMEVVTFGGKMRKKCFFSFSSLFVIKKAWKLEHKKLCTGIRPGGLSHSYGECGVERGLNHCSPSISPCFHCALPHKFVCDVRHLSKISWMVRKKEYAPPIWFLDFKPVLLSLWSFLETIRVV